MLFPSAEPTITYKLCGESLETAYEIHELSKEVNREYLEIEAKVKEYSRSLMDPLNQRFTNKFSVLLGKLSEHLGIPPEQIHMYHLDASYLDDHGIAFLKQSPGFVHNCEGHGVDEFPGEDGG